ncbi:probable rhamnogalacturonate lyase B [Tanacetum coccineum]
MEVVAPTVDDNKTSSGILLFNKWSYDDVRLSLQMWTAELQDAFNGKKCGCTAFLGMDSNTCIDSYTSLTLQCFLHSPTVRVAAICCGCFKGVNVGNKTYIPTTWTILFDLENYEPTGNYTIQLALASATATKLHVQINDPRGVFAFFTTLTQPRGENQEKAKGVVSVMRKKMRMSSRGKNMVETKHLLSTVICNLLSWGNCSKVFVLY